jgi:hypothetical protein
MIASQIEFSLVVPVCAWCKPRERGAPGAVSHGICLRHMKKLKLEARGVVVTRSRARGRRGVPQLECAGSALPLGF